MNIVKKGDKSYIITESENQWKAVYANGKTQIEVIIPKSSCKDIESVSDYIQKHNDIF